MSVCSVWLSLYSTLIGLRNLHKELISLPLQVPKDTLILQRIRQLSGLRIVNVKFEGRLIYLNSYASSGYIEFLMQNLLVFQAKRKALSALIQFKMRICHQSCDCIFMMFQFMGRKSVNRERPMFAADAPSCGGQIKPLVCLSRRAPHCSRHRSFYRI